MCSARRSGNFCWSSDKESKTELWCMSLGMPWKTCKDSGFYYKRQLTDYRGQLEEVVDELFPSLPSNMRWVTLDHPPVARSLVPSGATPRDPSTWSWSDECWATMGNLCQQASAHIPEDSFRLLSGRWSFRPSAQTDDALNDACNKARGYTMSPVCASRCTIAQIRGLKVSISIITASVSLQGVFGKSGEE